MKLTLKNLHPKRAGDKLLDRLIRTSKKYESFTLDTSRCDSFTIIYNKAMDGLPKPKITKNDLESWS